MKFEEGDLKAAETFAKMFLDNKLKFQTKHDDEIRFCGASRYKSKCVRCQTYYHPGEPIFYQNSKGWHERCASDQDRTLEFYTSWKAKQPKADEQGVMSYGETSWSTNGDYFGDEN